MERCIFPLRRMRQHQLLSLTRKLSSCFTATSAGGTGEGHFVLTVN